MEHFVTLFDERFIPQGLALRESLEQHAGPFTLWVLCMDEKTHEVLTRLALKGIRAVPLAEIETDQHRSIKSGRTSIEYCWTMTPVTPQMVFERDPTARRVTYVDADLWMLAHPGPVYDEFEASGKAVLLTEHAYDPEFDLAHNYGRFCVQFMVFVRDRSEALRACWEGQCIEWCHARTEDGRFGDQKYLDDWPEAHGELVHVASRPGWFLAPWNARCHSHESAVAWHFHGLRLLPGSKLLLHPNYPVPCQVLQQVYQPYIAALRRAVEAIGYYPLQWKRPTSLREWVRLFTQQKRVVRW